MQSAKQQKQPVGARHAGRAERLRTSGRRGSVRARRRVHLGEKAHQGVKTESGSQASGDKRVRCENAPGHPHFVFDTRNQLLRVEDDGTPVGTYEYDAFGLRVTKTTAEGTSQYTYDEQSVLLRRGPGGEQKFEYGPDRLLSVNDSNLGRAFYLFDGLGSVTNLTTETGSLLAQYRWDAWGNIREQTDTAANPFGFTGHEMDDESGLVYAKARFYDPVTGRFLSHDPVEGDPSNPPSLHRYLYAFQNPTVFVDPTGRMSEVSNIADAQQFFADNPEELRALLESFGGEAETFDVALASAVLERTAAGTRLANLLINIQLFAAADQQGRLDELRPDVKEELAASVNAFLGVVGEVQAAIDVIKEDPLAAGSQVLDFAKSQGRAAVQIAFDALAGDEDAAFQLEKFFAGLGIDIAAGAVAGFLGQAASAAGSVARRGGGLVDDLFGAIRRGQRGDVDTGLADADRRLKAPEGSGQAGETSGVSRPLRRGEAPPTAFRRTETLQGRAASRNVNQIAESMKLNGFFGDPIRVIEIDGRLYVLDGHHRLEAARQAGVELQFEVVEESMLENFGYKSAAEVLDAADNVTPNRLRR